MTEPSYSPKMIFNMASVRHLEFGNFWFFVTLPSPGIKFVCILNFVKFGRFRLRYGDIIIFNMAAVHHVEFGKLWVFVTFRRLAQYLRPGYQILSNSEDLQVRYGAMLDFRNLTFSSPNLCTRAIKPSNTRALISTNSFKLHTKTRV